MTFFVAEKTNTNVFLVFDQDTDDVIAVLNYLLENLREQKRGQAPPAKQVTEGEGVVRVGKAQDDIWNYI